MKRGEQEGGSVGCPDCGKTVPVGLVKAHIGECGKYVPTYINNINRCVSLLQPNYLHFLSAEMDIIKETLLQRIKQAHNNPSQNRPPVAKSVIKEEKMDIEVSQPNPNPIQAQPPPIKKTNSNAAIKKEEPPIEPKLSRQAPKMSFEGTLLLDEMQGIFDQDNKVPEERIECVYFKCKDPASANDIQKFTYLDECLHTICLFCLRDYVRNSFVKEKGELKCPGKCGQPIPYIQIKQVMDPTVLLKLQNQLNGKALDLIQCQKCHQVYQFEKGKPSDAPKKTPNGKNLTASMSKHYAQNRFQCPKCKMEQCQKCKEMPFHLGFNCQDFQEHKLKKKCRYCHAILPKGYMSETGIKALDDICDSEECSAQSREACGKTHPCGHACLGYIRQKSCLPCLNEKCAAAKGEQLRGQNENSYCSLCYVESLNEAPCVRSKCGHIFHFKCLKKRLELKWETARIIFRFCECPLCNLWLQLPEESPLSKLLLAFKGLLVKIKEKAMKRLVHEEANKDEALRDPASPYYKNQEKYALTIYAYFECFQCHEPYFGGRKSCAEAMGDRAAGQKFDPKELICAGCCPVQATDCKRHGKEYISFKCRFCCEVAQWFCWGYTHFCDGCHKRQINGEYISRIPKDKLPHCQGKGKCPVGGEHGGNGDQFCLGCGLCRGQRMDIKDF